MEKPNKPTVDAFLNEVEKNHSEPNAHQEKEKLEQKRKEDPEFRELAEEEEQKAREAEKYVGS
ncbi:MAG: hypothetical protein QM669_01340 [Siphonobacter sp.]